MRSLVVMLVLAAVPSQFAGSQQNPEPGCSATEYRQMDFVLGRWKATYQRAPEQVVGMYVFESAHGGCVVLEHWTGTADESGIGINAYDRDTGIWRHVWADATGSWVALSGHLQDGALRFEGEIADSSAKQGIVHARLVMEPHPDGKVRQTFTTSTDGENWAVRYRLLLSPAQAAGGSPQKNARPPGAPHPH